MRQLLSGLFSTRAYIDLIDKRRARAAYILIAAGIIFRLAFFTIDRTNLTLTVGGLETRGYTNLGGVLLLIVMGWWLRRGHLNQVRWVITVATYLNAILFSLDTGWTLQSLLVLFIFLLSATLLFDEWAVIASTGLTLLADIVVVVVVASDLAGNNAALDALFGNGMIVATFGVLLGILLYITGQGWRRGLNYMGIEAAERRHQMVELSAEVTKRIFNRMEMDTLLTDTVNSIRDRFEEIYHAQIFLIDDSGQRAELKASTGQVGQELLRRNHFLEVGSISVIGQVTVRGEPVMARDTSADAVHRRNELLPNTRTELALPMISGQSIIGALDVQSTRANAFSPDDISTLQLMANQIAVAIDNAKLFLQQQMAITENEQLAQQARTQVTQIQELNRRLTRYAWGEYLDQQDLVPALTVDFDQGMMTPNASWTPTLLQATELGKTLHQHTDDDKTILAVPLRIRGQVIGAMEFELDGDAEPDRDTIALTEDVAGRLSLSLESARLYDEAQRLAHREQVINDISTRLQGASGVESALMMAAQGLQNALHAPRIAIRLGTPPSPPGQPPSNGNGNSPSEEVYA